MIAKTNEQGQPIGTGEYVVTLELKDKRMGKSETDKARLKLKRMIAPSILKQMGIEPILTSTAYKNARIYSQVVFTETAFQRIQGLSAAQIEVSLTKYLVESEDSFADKEKSIRKASLLLAESLKPGKTPEEKIRLFADLQKEKLFREVGTGFMMSLLPEQELEDLVSVYVRVDATAFGDKPIKVAFGHSDFRNLEKATECADYQQNRQNIDLRLEDVCAAPVADAPAATAPSLVTVAPVRATRAQR